MHKHKKKAEKEKQVKKKQVKKDSKPDFLPFLLDPKVALSITVGAYFAIVLLTYVQSYFPAGIDTSTHLFQIWLFQTEGFTAWNPWWYAGNPLLDQYPPLTHFVPSLLSGIIGVETSYKLFFAIALLALPISFFLLLQEFKLSEAQRSVALYFFSFSSILVHYFQGGVFSELASIPFVILFFKYFVRYLNDGKMRSATLSSIFMALTALSHLFNPVIAGLIAAIFVFCFSMSITGIKRLITVGLLSLLLVAFFWVPLARNYHFNTTSPDFAPLKFAQILVEMVFRIFSYFNILSFVLLVLLGIVFILGSYYLTRDFFVKHNKKTRQSDLRLPLFFVLIILIPVLLAWALPSPYSSDFKNKTPPLYPIFFGIVIAGFVGHNRKFDFIIGLLIFGMFFSFVMHPIPQISNQVADFSKWSASFIDHRALFLPQGYEFLPPGATSSNSNEYLYSVYLLPSYDQKEVYNGWFGELAPHLEKDDRINFYCTSPKSFGQMFSEISLFGDTIRGSFASCQIEASKEEFCSVLQEASVDTIFVNSRFLDVVDYVEHSPCIQKLGELDFLYAYKIKDTKPYVDNDFAYVKQAGKISVSIVGPYDGNLTVRESYYPYWTASIWPANISIGQTKDGFISVPVLVSKGTYELNLTYSPPRFGNMYLLISIIAWAVALLLVFPQFSARFANIYKHRR
ncbi:MAG: hypothetical protein ABII22_01980 [Candidatus Micrarchaeota archaeon]